MNFSIFSVWLQRFGDYVAQPNRIKVTLLIVNASSHEHIKDLPVLSNVEVIDLRKNTKSCLKPLDDSLISSLARRYRRKQCQRALCFLEEENTQDF